MSLLAARRTGAPSDLPLVLIHAMPLDGSMWDEVRAELSDIDVITVDAPGFGDSPSGAELEKAYGYDRPGVDVIVDALKATLDFLGVERCVIGGMSMGGSVTAAFVQAHPQMIAGMALMDTNIAADVPAHTQMRLDSIAMCEEGKGYESVRGWTTFFVSPSTGDDVRESLDRRFRQLKDESLAWLQKALMNRSDATAALELCDGPILLERGVDDATCSLETLNEWKERAANARVVEIESAGHFVADEKPAELAKELRALYNSI